MADRAPAFYADARSLNVPLNWITPPVTVAKARAAGVDVERLKRELAALRGAVTAIPPRRWTVRAGKGDYPNQLSLAYSTASRSPQPFEFSRFQMRSGGVYLSVRLRDQRQQFTPETVDWTTFHSALRGLHEACMGTLLQMKPSKMKAGKPNEYGDVEISFAYAFARG